MKLIADCGSTKIQWCAVEEGKVVKEFFTPGMNAIMLTEEEMAERMGNELKPEVEGMTFESIYFYGAGCINDDVCGNVRRAIAAHVPAPVIEVYTDLLAAARALFGHEAGIACILGTGANSCLWNGKEIEKNVPALGFILGDEGSGAVLGKRLVADLLKNQLSDELKEKFLTQYGITAADVIENVYRKPFPNRYLASLSKFCSENMDNPLIAQLVYDHFDYFAKRILPQYPALPVGFIGSIAYYYQDVLKKVLADNGFQVGKILQGPMEGLKEYHKKDVEPTM